MTILEQAQRFSARFGKEVAVAGITWRYYRLGAGPPILWLTGGLRRVALGFAFMERLAERHTVIAPDYPPVQTIDGFLAAFDAILQAEGVERFNLGGQSYGGLLAQAYLARRPEAVERLILSSTGPADFGRGWLLAEYAVVALVRVLPEKTAKGLLTRNLLRALAIPEAVRTEWLTAVEHVMQNELSRADVVSHFGVAADLLRKDIVTPAAYRGWRGRVVVLSAENDPTQRKQDISRYERLFGRPVEVINMGDMGHAAALFDPDKFVALLEQALD